MVVYLLLGFAVCRTTVPLPDEALISNPSFNLATRGVLATTLFSANDTARATGCFSLKDCLEHSRLSKTHKESYFGMDRYTYWVLPAYLILQAAWYWIVGFGVMQTRLLPLFAGLVLIWACYEIVLRLFQSSRAACIAAVLLAIDMTVLTTASFGRMDMFCAAMGYLGIALYLRWRESQFSRAVLWSNAAAALALFSQPNGALAVMALVMLTLYFDWRKIGIRQVALAGVPYAMIGIGWVCYIAQSPTTFLSQFLGNASGRGGGITAPLTAIRNEFLVRYGSKFGLGEAGGAGSRIKLVILGVFAVAVLSAFYLAWRQWDSRRRSLLLLFLLYAVVLTFGEGMKFSFYLIHIVPWYVCLCAVVADSALAAARPYRIAAVVCLLVLGVVDGAVWLNRIRTNAYSTEFLPLARFVAPELPRTHGAVCVPAVAFGLGFPSTCPWDTALGLVNSPTHPDLIAVSDDWLRDFEDSRNVAPDIYNRINATLASEYTPAYDSKRFRVYRRR
jgi:4-amino-4-deoxy-L-arabinose transferase-like glycosyltransferase